MQTFKVKRLNANTPKPDQTKLLTALHGVAGVERAILHPESNEFQIKPKAEQKPKRSDISAAASKAGFAVADKQ